MPEGRIDHRVHRAHRVLRIRDEIFFRLESSGFPSEPSVLSVVKTI
jgi:hypothetical protein